MSEKEPEVVHLEWERVEDPERDPPPELVVAEPEQVQPRPHIIPRWDDPNPLSQPQTRWLTYVIYALAFIAWQLWMRAVGIVGN